MDTKEKFEKLQQTYGENQLLAIVNNYVIHINTVDHYILNHVRMNNICKMDGEEYIVLDVIYFINEIMNGNFNLLFYLTERSEKVYINPNYSQFVEKLFELCRKSVDQNILAISHSLREKLIKMRKDIFMKAPYNKEALALYIEYGYYYINGRFALTDQQIVVLESAAQPMSIDFVKTMVHKLNAEMATRDQELLDAPNGESFNELLELRKELDLLVLNIVKTAYNMFTIVALI